jgi:hypothetical protein
VRLSRSTWSRSRAPNASMIPAASWRRRLNWRSTARWMWRRAGWKAAATARVAAATARLELWGSSRPSPRTTAAYPRPRSSVSRPPGQGPADDAVQVVQPIAQDRGAGGQRQDHHTGAGSDQDHAHRPSQHRGGHRDHQRHRRHRRRERQPAQLLTFHALGPPIADRQRPGGHHQPGQDDRRAGRRGNCQRAGQGRGGRPGDW